MPVATKATTMSAATTTFAIVVEMFFMLTLLILLCFLVDSRSLGRMSPHGYLHVIYDGP
jgi:flagellar biogenesis protein FliO